MCLAALTFAACGALGAGAGSEIVSGHVTEVVQIGQHVSANGAPQPFQELRVQLDDSLYRGDVVELEWDGGRGLDANAYLRPGDRVLLSMARSGNDRAYAIDEVVRLPTLAPIAIVLVLALLLVARVRGLTALAGIVLSVTVFLLAVVPAVRTGGDPLVSTLLGSVAAGTLTVFVVHGVSRRSLLAIGGTLAGLGIATAAGSAAIAAARLSGIGTDEQVTLALTATRGDRARHPPRGGRGVVRGASRRRARDAASSRPDPCSCRRSRRAIRPSSLRARAAACRCLASR